MGKQQKVLVPTVQLVNLRVLQGLRFVARVQLVHIHRQVRERAQIVTLLNTLLLRVQRVLRHAKIVLLVDIPLQVLQSVSIAQRVNFLHYRLKVVHHAKIVLQEHIQMKQEGPTLHIVILPIRVMLVVLRGQRILLLIFGRVQICVHYMNAFNCVVKHVMLLRIVDISSQLVGIMSMPVGCMVLEQTTIQTFQPISKNTKCFHQKQISVIPAKIVRVSRPPLLDRMHWPIVLVMFDCNTKQMNC